MFPTFFTFSSPLSLYLCLHPLLFSLIHLFSLLTKNLAHTNPMAVEAQHYHLLSPQTYKNRESMNPIVNPSHMFGGNVGLAGVGPSGPVYNTAVPAATNVRGVVDSNNGVLISKKRSRDSISFLGEDVSSQVYNHMSDVDRLIVQHVLNARMELSQKRGRLATQIIDSVSKQLRSKDEEIDQLKKLNWAMEERIKSLAVENNAWRYLAQTQEAAAAALRENLNELLADQAAAVGTADDAESCCGDNFGDKEPASADRRRMCRNCGDGEPSVLLLPCRHLCLCASCGPRINMCPICKCSKNGSVNVNLC